MRTIRVSNRNIVVALAALCMAGCTLDGDPVPLDVDAAVADGTVSDASVRVDSAIIVDADPPELDAVPPDAAPPDARPLDANPPDMQVDGDVGAACSDTDGDGVCDTDDNCVQLENAEQRDLDHDGEGDACDADDDGDGIDDLADNCAQAANPDQLDVDDDGLGDVCDDRIDIDEICNAVDDDLDGAVDEALAEVPEQCNGADDDCDGEIDEGPLDCPTEACNAVDDDGDGRIDEGEPGLTLTEVCPYSGPPATQDVGQCRAGTRRCTAAQWRSCQGERTPLPEACNRRDDDCDGATDEDLAEQPELCNGVDDDCDGRTDEGLAVGEACEAGGCDAGVWRCSPDGQVVCSAFDGAQPETCNAADDDCDGRVDEDAFLACTAGVGACQQPGQVACLAEDAVCDAVPLEPGIEIANGVDDDCDFRVDEGLIGVGCDAACGEGLLVCDDPECAAPICQPPMETCGDGLDNDCDGTIDEAGAVRRLPAAYTAGRFDGLTLLAWGDGRIARFTLDARAVAVAEIEALGRVTVVEPIGDEWAVLGERRTDDQVTFTFARFTADLRPVTPVVAWHQAPSGCFMVNPAHLITRTGVIAAIEVPGGLLAFHSSPCADEPATLAVTRLDMGGGAGPTHRVRRGRCEPDDWFDWGLCPVFPQRVGETIRVATSGHADFLDWGPAMDYTLDLDGAPIRERVLGGGPADAEYTRVRAQSGPLIAITHQLFNGCGGVQEYLTVGGLTGQRLTASLTHRSNTFETLFFAQGPDDTALVRAHNREVYASLSAGTPPEAVADEIAVATLDVGESLAGAGRTATGGFALLTKTRNDLGVRQVGWPSCAGGDADCDGEVDEGCPPAGPDCPPGSAWVRPGGFWTRFAGELPTFRPERRYGHRAHSSVDDCGRVILTTEYPDAPVHRCGQAGDDVSRYRYEYDAAGSLMRMSMDYTEFPEAEGWGYSIAHEHDAQGRRSVTRAGQSCGAGFDVCGDRPIFRLRIEYHYGPDGRLARETADFELIDGPPAGLVDRTSTFTWDDAAHTVTEHVDLEADGDVDQVLIHRAP